MMVDMEFEEFLKDKQQVDKAMNIEELRRISKTNAIVDKKG